MWRSIWAIFWFSFQWCFSCHPRLGGISHSFTLEHLHTAHNSIFYIYICTQFCIHKNASSLWKFVGKWSWNENQRSSKRRKQKTPTFCIRINNNNNGMAYLVKSTVGDVRWWDWLWLHFTLSLSMCALLCRNISILRVCGYLCVSVCANNRNLCDFCHKWIPVFHFSFSFRSSSLRKTRKMELGCPFRFLNSMAMHFVSDSGSDTEHFFHFSFSSIHIHLQGDAILVSKCIHFGIYNKINNKR